MCGIAGIYAYHYAANPVDRAELARIQRHMRARGPDGTGEWFSADGRVGLTHGRLAIIAPDERGAQPMVRGAQVVSYNGEIYNYRALRSDLERAGVACPSGSDTEVLLALYEREGVDMLRRLRGMYAFALWDGRRQALLLARDPYGIKPLYYADDGWTLRCASQVKALIAGGHVARDPEPAGHAGFYIWGSVPEPFTLYQEVRALPAGHFLWVTATGAAAPRPHQSVARILQAGAAADAGNSADGVRAALADSVRHHLVSDVPVGVFLSGGVDSGALAGLMREQTDGELCAITASFDEFAGTAEDETPRARASAERYGLKHVLRRYTREDLGADLPRIFAAMDQPSIDGINTWIVARAAREAGLKVAISGLGGDELFRGYPSFDEVPLFARAGRVLSWLPLIRAALKRAAPAMKVSPKLAGLGRYRGIAGAYLLKRGLFLPEELEALLGSELFHEGLRRLQALPMIEALLEPAASALAQVAALETSLYLRNQLLRDADWAGMAHGVEIRPPLVDAELLRQLAPLLARGELSKADLAAAPATPLPDAVARAPKTGFLTPVARWLQEMPELDAWKRVPALTPANCPWARRWSAVVMAQFT